MEIFNKLEKRLKVNKIASMYAKENLSNFLEKNIKENNILQVNSKRLQELITNRGLQLPKLVQSTLIIVYHRVIKVSITQ